MNTISTLRVGAVALGALAVTALSVAAGQDDRLGFVITDISYALSSSKDATEMCPKGLSLGPRDLFAATPEGKRHEGESDADYTRRLGAGAQAFVTAPNGQNLCMN